MQENNDMELINEKHKLTKESKVKSHIINQKDNELKTTKMKLKEVSKLSDLGKLAATVAHELRNPLSVIGTAVFNIREKRTNPSIDKQLNNIDKNLKESEQIINNLLLYARIKEPHIESLCLNDIINNAMNTIEGRFSKSQVTIHNTCDLDASMQIKADHYQLIEILNNILINAYQSYNKKKGIIDIHSYLENPKTVSIVIKDYGSGIPEQITDKIFDPFFTTKSKGTGLGLGICQELIRRHNGSITIRSICGKGTTVTISLPLG